MATKSLGSIDFAQIQQKVASQFKDLDPKDPSSWPPFPRYALFLAVTVAVVVALWFVWLSGSDEVLQQEQEKEGKLRIDYKAKLTKAVNLDVLKKQREQVQQYVTQLEKQLPSKAEMDALLSDINQAGLGRSLQFDLFRPGQVAVKDYYAELPITIRVVGRKIPRYRGICFRYCQSVTDRDSQQLEHCSKSRRQSGARLHSQNLPVSGPK
jgi:type IV pilus assembly protein PilO